ncbi:MAG: flagellar hook-associated protein FlgK [Lachnospiraceae bacterium]
MANTMGSLFIGASGLKSSQNALNTTANNLANVDTAGYVRQQVVFEDSSYTNLNQTAAISKMQSGLGVSIGEVVHAREIFLDKTYRTENGRSSYYSATSDVISELETYFQELQGSAFQDVLSGDSGFWVAFQELAKDPSNSVNQNLVVQKASLFLSRAKSVYEGISTYQANINSQVSVKIDRINELAATIDDLNKRILNIESAGVETAKELRDARDSAMDELSSLGNITYKELPSGVVKLSFENVTLVDERTSYSIGKKMDGSTGFISPYWESLSDTENDKYQYVYDFSKLFTTTNSSDIGELRALLLARGNASGTYADMQDVTYTGYNQGIGRSVLASTQAKLDLLVNKIVTSINDLFCPNISSTPAITGTDESGNTVSFAAGTKILDVENATVGADGSLPPNELFSRLGTDRYTKVTASDGSEYYVYNEPSDSDTSLQYSTMSLLINPKLEDQESLLPTFHQDGSVAYQLGEDLADLWEAAELIISPNNTTPSTFEEYYEKLISDIATAGDVFESTAINLSSSVQTIENARQQVIGVSADEELTNMIKYQNAYNASSRYINVVDEMIEMLITQMG